MKTLVILIVFLTTSAIAQDRPMTDKERARESVAVFTGDVVSCGFDTRVKGNDYYKATIHVIAIEKADPLLSTNTVTILYPTGTKIEPKQTVKCWCVHWDHDGRQFLYVPWPSWIKKQ